MSAESFLEAVGDLPFEENPNFDAVLIGFVYRRPNGATWLSNVQIDVAMEFVRDNAATLRTLLASLPHEFPTPAQADAIEGYRQVGPC